MKCPAKINLFLKLISKRDDGYHELESVFSEIDLYDNLEVKKSDKFSLKISGEFAQFVDLEKNILTKILDYFVENFAIDRNLEINLEKNIPVGAGMGGGSSDAAYFMMALNEIFELGFSKKKLQEISLNFGSDIAFFFEGGLALVRGRGEVVKPFPGSPLREDDKEGSLALKQAIPPLSSSRSGDPGDLAILLINPKISVSTPTIFKNFDKNFSQKLSNEEIRNKTLLEIIALPNDLTKAAIATCPEIKIILDTCQKLNCKIAKMSGSGSTCFAVFEGEDLERAYDYFAKEFPGFFVKKFKLSSRA